MSIAPFKTGRVSDELAKCYQNHQISQTIDPESIKIALSKIKNTFFVEPHTDIPGWLHQHTSGAPSTEEAYLIGRYKGFNGFSFYMNPKDLLPRIRVSRPYSSHYELRRSFWIYIPSFINNQIILTPHVEFDDVGWGFSTSGRPFDREFENLQGAITQEMESKPDIISLKCPPRVVSFTTTNHFGELLENYCYEKETKSFLKLIGLS